MSNIVERIYPENSAYAFADWSVDAFHLSAAGPVLSCPVSGVQGAVRAAEAAIAQHAADIGKAGGLFFGKLYDPFDTSNPDVTDFTGQVYSSCQALGIPTLFLTTRFGWAEGYAGYAAMLGIRRSIVAFGSSFCQDDLPSWTPWRERIEALKSLHDSGFKTWAFLDNITNFCHARTVVRELEGHVDFLYFDVPSRRDTTCKAEALNLETNDSRLLDFADEVALFCERAKTPWFFMSNFRSWLTHPDDVHYSHSQRFRLFDNTELVRPDAVDSVGAAEDAYRDAMEEVRKVAAPPKEG